MTSRLLLALRLMLAAVWLYNGLVLKLWRPDPHHVQVVEAVGGFGGLSPMGLLRLIGKMPSLLLRTARPH